MKHRIASLTSLARVHGITVEVPARTYHGEPFKFNFYWTPKAAAWSLMNSKPFARMDGIHDAEVFLNGISKALTAP